MKIHYKNYELSFNEDGDVDGIFLNDEEVGIDNCPEATEQPVPESLASAIEWINEDIRCRLEETDETPFFDADWDKRIPVEEAKKIIENGDCLGDCLSEKDCYWRCYSLDNKYYMGLCDNEDLWEVPRGTVDYYLN